MARGKKPGERVQGDYAASLHDLEQAVATFPHLNFYVCPNPTFSRVGVRHSGGDVSHWSWFLLDIDPLDGAANPDPEGMLIQALLWLTTKWGRILTPLLIDSGRGRQAWFRLDDTPLDGLWLSRRDVSRAQRYWLTQMDEDLGEQHGCRIDTTCSDLPRPMRCPGTTNLKTGRAAYMFADGLADPGLQTIIMNVPAEVLQMPDPTGPAHGLPWQYAMPHMTNKARTFVMDGWTEPGRHEAAWHTAKRLQEAGVTREEARRALWNGNKQCHPRPLDDKDIEHALETAYRK